MYDENNPVPVEGWYAKDHIGEPSIEAHTLHRCGVTEPELEEIAIGEVFRARNGQWFIKINKTCHIIECTLL